MCPSPPRRIRWRLAVPALALLALAPAAATSEPSADELRVADARLAAREQALDARMSSLQGELADGRARLEEARRRHRSAQAGLARRLRAMYVRSEPTPLVTLLLGGSLTRAQEEADLMKAIGRRDHELVETSRRTAAALRAADDDLARRRVELTAVRRGLGVDRALVRGRLAAAVERERAAAAPVAAGGVLTTTGPTGLPVAFGEPPDASESPQGGRGLPEEFLRARRLPGAAPKDADSGRPIDVRPAPAGQEPARAYPGVGIVGPSGSPLEGNLPTFTARAGWYGPDARRVRTASGEAYDPRAFSAASRTLRFGTLLRVGYGGRVVTVRVNDRGPYVRGRDLDLSQAAAAALRLPGVGTVTVQILPDAA